MTERSERPAVEIAALADPARLRSLTDTGLDAAPDEAFDRFARLVGDLLDVPVALVSLVTETRQFFPGAVGLPDPWAARRQTPLSHSFCQHVIDTEIPLVLPDARLYPRVRENLAVPELGVVAYAGMPLTDLDGRVLGSLCAIDSKPRAWTKAQLRTLADLAAACSSELRLRIALDAAQEARRLVEHAHDRLNLLASLSETLAGTLDVETAVGRLADAVVPLLADWAMVTLTDRAGTPRRVTAVHRDPARAAEVARFGELARHPARPRLDHPDGAADRSAGAARRRRPGRRPAGQRRAGAGDPRRTAGLRLTPDRAGAGPRPGRGDGRGDPGQRG